MSRIVIWVAIAGLWAGGCSCSEDAGPGSSDAAMDTGPGGDAGDSGAPLDAGSDALPDSGPPRCGDEIVQPAEECDDGNTVDGDGCKGDCTSNERCGNSIVDMHVGEVCDDGNTANGDGCSADCTSNEECGNMVVDLGTGEVCDDGNMVDGDGCSADCMTGPTCGDGTTHPPEVCDDGNTADGDGCRGDCRAIEACGNFVIDAGEECDDGDTDGGDGCSAICQVEACGNGRTDTGEDCDDGNAANGDGCDDDCTFSCEADADCGAAGPCVGPSTCDATAHTCVAGGPLLDGTACGPGPAMACTGGVCLPSVCGDGRADASEACDDGNSVDGDGCDNDCTFSCGSDAECDDGLPCNGAETCDLGTRACRNPADLADGTPCGGGLVCRGGACAAVVCGNGMPEPGEQCDDGNTTEGDGCDNDCTFSCVADAGCTDGAVCNGAETCNLLTHVCRAGTPPSNGTACDRDMMPGTRDICRMASCVASRCGDRFVDAGAMPAEQCDDGNGTDGDGCDSDCTFSCVVDGDCNDRNVCNGAETCNVAMHVCRAGTAAPDGTVCDRDMMPGTRDICRMASCLPSACGDGFLDMGTMPPEQCDDGNLVAGDGCEPSCRPTGPRPTAYRVTSMAMRDPHFYIDFFGCRDVTDTPFLGFSLNGSLQSSINDYTLNYINVFRPLDIAMSTNPLDVVQGRCMAGPPVSCDVGPGGVVTPTTANNMGAGMGVICYQADPTTLTAAYTDPNIVGGPCFVSDPEIMSVSVSGVTIPLQDARVAATYSGGPPPTRLVSGVISGFISEAAAMMVILPDTLPLVGGDTLYEHLAAGGAPGSSCSPRDDRDTYMGTRGFWMYFDFAGDVVAWTGP